ncbi:MAG: hypothetical protein F9K51_08240 [Candidatus Dadabacteria bacterium]|nr:MAG: hypothetical protein F9K51_08240 [Candidatus Dadabacteria bacterium]MCL4245355.1 hypothetical protein [Candidatus Dadabacteria bacterium]
MELFISMKAENLNKGIYFKESNIMQMPTAQSAGFFIAEFREGDPGKLILLRRYSGLLKSRLAGDAEYFLEETTIGFKLYKKVDEEKEYMEAWEDWVVFSRRLLRELKGLVGDD